MWKYTGVNECNEFLLSLDLLNCKDKRKYIKILYTLANSQEKNYREFKIKKEVALGALFMSLVKYWSLCKEIYLIMFY